MKDKYTAIVLSAGSGSRMKSDIPKQYMDLLGKPVLYYSLWAFQQSDIDEIIIVCGVNDIEYCRKEIVEKYGLTKVKKVVAGGKERYQSVFEGLKAAENADYVLIHDGARPMLDNDIISNSIRAVKKYEACVVGVPVKDTIKVIGADGYAYKTPNRNFLWQVQTPQSFSRSLLMQSYSKLYMDVEEGKQVPSITDDAMIVEYGSSIKVKMVEGNYKNIKVTTPEDMGIAAIFLKEK